MATTMANPAPDDLLEESPYTVLATDILDFLRDSDCVQAIDLGVWLVSGNAEGQFAAYLAERVKNPEFPGLRLSPPDLA